jgi:hypothetical protein
MKKNIVLTRIRHSSVIYIQDDPRVIMSSTELKMQPTIHLERKGRCFPRPYPAVRSKSIVGCKHSF